MEVEGARETLFLHASSLVESLRRRITSAVCDALEPLPIVLAGWEVRGTDDAFVDGEGDVKPSIVACGECSKKRKKRRNVLCRCLPQGVRVDRRVTVNQSVAHRNDVPPGDLRCYSTRLDREPARSLAHDLDSPYQRVKQHPVPVEIILAAPGYEGYGGLCFVDHVWQSNVIITEHIVPQPFSSPRRGNAGPGRQVSADRPSDPSCRKARFPSRPA